MAKFIKKIILFLFIISICCCIIAISAFHIVGSQYVYNYQASIIDKIKRLESINEPKIILVGHSNLAFGIDSKKIEDALKMPVVNLGLHGGLGNAFHEEMAKLNINKGDIVVVCHSDFSDTDEINDKNLAWITIDNNSKIFNILRKKDYPAMLTAYPNYLKNSFLLWLSGTGNNDEGGCYSRNAFNEYGDIVYRPDSGQMDTDLFFSGFEVTVPEINDICIGRLNKYNTYITECGATMLIAGYPIAYGKYASFNDEDFTAFGNRLKELLNCDIISDYTDYFYPYDYFYDTQFHLTAEGAEIRTEQLISDLEKWMLSKKTSDH